MNEMLNCLNNVTNQVKRGHTRVACVKRAVERTIKGRVTGDKY